MRTQRISETIIPLPLSMSTCYLLPCEGGYLQIDTGYEKDYSLYRKNLAKVGVPVQEIKLVLLTHHHDDHAGFLNDLTQDTEIKIIAHENAVKLLSEGKNDKSRGGGYVSKLIAILADIKSHLDTNWTLSFPPFKMRPTDRLVAGDDNQLLREFGVPGKILYTPGHSIDHLALVLDTGETFCGDAAADMYRWTGTDYFPVFMTNIELAYQSWDRLVDAGAKLIIPAHGKPFSSEKLKEFRGRITNEDLVKFF